LNIENPVELLAYLRERSAIGTAEEPEVRRLGGGVSNRAVLVRRSGGESWVLKQGLAKLRVEADWFCSPERVYREAAGLRWLKELTPPGTIPNLVFEDRENYLFAMEAIPTPHKNWKQMLLAGDLLESHVLQFAHLIAAIHRKAADEVSRLEAEFGDRSFFEALRLEPYYSYTARQIPRSARFFEQLLSETRRHRLTLVHGDYSPKNILVFEERFVLLDHEVIHYGDPAFDLGFSLTHLLSKANHLENRRDQFLGAASLYWKTYWSEVALAGWAQGLEARSVRQTLGCLLARVAGRSPLEYLTRSDRKRQREAAIAMLRDLPKDMEGMIEGFRGELLRHA